uniref:Cytochrome P450 CYP749A22-like n=2 Tax=Populus alba TaxID=43335 RepID=A0A4U5Q0Z5_POPAL|nr:cytochrome P450 CYP749A22-like [Populus alba]
MKPGLSGEPQLASTTQTFYVLAGYDSRYDCLRTIFKSSDDIESENLEKRVRESIIRMMKKREEEATSGQLDGYGNDFFGLLLKAYHDPDNSENISVDDLIDECKTIYVAGQETTTSLLSWTVLLLAICPDWQDKVRKEVLELIGQQNPSPDSMTKLKIMSMVINESLRLYAPFNYLARKVDKEVRLGNLILPANMEIYMSTLAHHYNPEIWGEDVHLFKPERFAEGVAKATNKSIAAFFPFGMGPRTCLGFNYAIIEGKIALSMILQRYRFTLSPTYVHRLVHLLTVCPKRGIQVILQPL